MEEMLYEPDPEASKSYYPLEKCLDASFTKKAAKAIERHIRQYPDHIEAYWLQWDYAAHSYLVDQDQVDRYLLKAYDKVLEIIPNAKGQWPKRLPWGWLENRSIHRILLGMGELYTGGRGQSIRPQGYLTSCSPWILWIIRVHTSTSSLCFKGIVMSIS
jgi:hypothetical protein